MACVALILAAVLTSASIPFLGGLFVALCALILLARVPLGPALLLACYPVLFSSLFLLSRWDGTWQSPALLLLRSLTSSLSAVLLVATTPYPDLFAPIARVLPRPAGDSLFLTYRALFALLQRADRLWRALRLRGGFTGPVRRRLAHTGEGLGVLVVHSFERSRRIYETMHLRGHSGRVCGCRHWIEGTPYDLLVLGVALAFGSACVIAARWA